MENIKERYKRFKEWEQQPHEVAPLSEDEHVCATCGTRFEGNYCPRCGQSARIGRYSFKKALLLFLDVWGVGNRGMFRSLRDLILRPGYMIRDYLLNIKGLNYYEQHKAESSEFAESVAKRIVHGDKQSEAKEKTAETKSKTATDKKLDDLFDRATAEVNRIENNLDEWGDSHEQFTDLIYLLLFTFPLWLLIRHCPAIPDMRLSECFVAMVYITNMLTIYTIIPMFFCFSLKAGVVYEMLATLLFIIPIKQLSGYSYWHTIWRVVAALIPFFGILCMH